MGSRKPGVSFETPGVWKHLLLCVQPKYKMPEPDDMSDQPTKMIPKFAALLLKESIPMTAFASPFKMDTVGGDCYSFADYRQMALKWRSLGI